MARKKNPWRQVKRKVRERDIESYACRWASERGWWHRKFKSIGRRSAPDRVFAKREGDVRLCLFVEFKRPGEVPTDLQAEEHRVMREAGLRVEVVDSKEAFITLFTTLEAELDGWLG